MLMVVDSISSKESFTILKKALIYTVCPRSSDPFYIVTYYMNLGHYFLDRRYIVGIFIFSYPIEDEK